MPRILIAGCGYVGQAAADLFQSADGKSKGGPPLRIPSARAFAQSRTRVRARGCFTTSPRSRPCRSIRCCPSLREFARRRRGRLSPHLFGGRTESSQRFPRCEILFTSSTSVYAQTDGTWVDEKSRPIPTHETGQDSARGRRTCSAHTAESWPGWPEFMVPVVLFFCASFSRGEAVIDRARTIALSTRRIGTTSRQRCFCLRGTSGLECRGPKSTM